MIQSEPGYFFVMRTHSGPTSNKVTYQLMSRRFDNKQTAENWASYIAKCQSNKNHEVFVVSVEDICFAGKTGERLTSDGESV
jgi:hypothetical protein